MGTHIEAAWAQAGNGRRRATARGLADAAARNCFALAGRMPGDIDMLINVGMYREDNMGEPALAALIQEDIGANLGQPSAGRTGTFSFDLLNGACGAITAIQIESGLLKSGVIRLGAVVSSDVQPDLEDPRVAFLRPAGGAILLRMARGPRRVHRLWRGDVSGVPRPVHQRTGVAGTARDPRSAAGQRAQRDGRHRANPVTRPAWPTAPRRRPAASCAAWAWASTDIDLLVPAPSAPDFLDPLRARLGIPGDRVAYTPEDLEGAYTTGPIAALQAAIKSGRLAEARNTLLLAAGPGVTIALALYRQTAP